MPLKPSEIDAAVAIESCCTAVTATGLPAYLGWHGAPVATFIIYAAAAGLAITIGIYLSHRWVLPRTPAGVLGTWAVRSAMVGLFGGFMFAFGTALHGKLP